MAQPSERRRRAVPVELDRLRWIAVVLPVAFILTIEALRHQFVEQNTANEGGHLALAGMLIVGVITFSIVMFLGIEATQRHLVRQNHELAAVDAVSTAIQGELGLDVVIDAALESVMASTGATEASVHVFGYEGELGAELGFERHRVVGQHADAIFDALECRHVLLGDAALVGACLRTQLLDPCQHAFDDSHQPQWYISSEFP